MGRYYHGDIEGKFAFACQSSLAPNRFGVEGEQVPLINWYFDEDDLPKIRKELDAIEALPKFKRTKKFFEDNNGYNDEMLKANNLTIEDASDYFDWELGKQIEECVVENGECDFQGEL